MRVGQLGVQEELKVGAVLDLLVAQLDRAALLDEESAEERVEHGLDLLVEVLDEEGLAVRDAVLDRVQVGLLPQPDHRQLVREPAWGPIQFLFQFSFTTVIGKLSECHFISKQMFLKNCADNLAKIDIFVLICLMINFIHFKFRKILKKIFRTITPKSFSASF